MLEPLVRRTTEFGRDNFSACDDGLGPLYPPGGHTNHLGSRTCLRCTTASYCKCTTNPPEEGSGNLRQNRDETSSLPMPPQKNKRVSRTAQLLAASKAAPKQAAKGKKKKAKAPAPQPTFQPTARMPVGKVRMRPMSFPVPVSQPCGSATTYYGARKVPIPLNTTTDRLIFIANTGDSSGVMGMVTRLNSSGALTFNVYGLNKINTAGTATAVGPTSGRAQTCSFELTNYSNPLSAGGEILIIPLAQRLGVTGQPSDWQTSGGFNSVVAALMDYKAFKPHNLIDFMHVTKTKQFYCSVADRNIYERFEPWKSVEPDTPPGFNEFATEFMTWEGLGARRPRGMNYYAIYIPAVATPQTLNFTVRAAYYLRWALNTPMAEMQTSIPVSRGLLPETPRVSAAYANSTGGII